MKSRPNRNVIRNFDIQSRRPSHQLLEKVQELIASSETILNQHTYWYGDAIKQFNLMKAAHADVAELVKKSEIIRPSYVRDSKLNEQYESLRAQERMISQSMADLRSGKTLREWEAEKSLVSGELHTMHMAQIEQKTQQEEAAKKIFARLNQEKANSQKAVEGAKARLTELENAANKTGCCTGNKNQAMLDEQVERQSQVLAHLVQNADTANARVLEETVRKPAAVQIDNNRLDILQKRYERARQMIKQCSEQLDDLLAQKQKELNTVKVATTKTIRSINYRAQRHYSNVDSQVMHGLLRVYQRLHDYKTFFDLAVTKYGKHVNSKGEAAAYSKQLATARSRVERLMNRLWSNDLRNLTAKQVSNQFRQLPQKSRDALLLQKPAARALQDTMGAAVSIVATPATVSTGGIFKKPVHPDTAKKRAHLKKEVRFKM